MPSEPRWISVEQLIEWNRLSVAETGEPFCIRDQNLLESACAKPQNHWHYDGQRDLVVLAIQLLLGVARNHPFEQGNKRTAFAAADAFLYVNGLHLSGEIDHAEYADMVVAAITGAMSEEGLISTLRVWIEVEPRD